MVFTDGNDGEQRRPKGDLMVRHKDAIVPECDMGDIVAFETNPHYVYTCGDGTKSYNWVHGGDYVKGGNTYEPQLEHFTRQYVYLLPNTFVVYDRAVGVKAGYRKVWQLHSWTEPTVSADTITTKQGEGQLTCMTLLPENPVMKKELQELTGSESTRADIWRVTVEREAPVKEEQFLHVIHVGDASGYRKPDAARVDGDGTVGAEITADEMTYTVTFNTTGPVGGHVTVKKGAETLIDKDLTTEVQPQTGYTVE